jgi:hypothetical protein
MSEIVFILGAGASKEAGAPLMCEFLDRADKVRRGPRSQVDHEAFKLVFQAISQLTSVHSKAKLDLDNLEDVFGAFEMARAIGVFPGYAPSDIEKLTSSFRWVVADTLEETIEFRIAHQQILPSPSYGRLAQLVLIRP